MIAPVFLILKNNPIVTALLGTAPLRVYPWGEAPQDTQYPYVTYGVANGNPENYLNQVPDIDSLGTQVDVWAKTVQSCNAVSIAVRNALETSGHMTSFSGNERDRETKLYRTRMDFDFFEER